MHSGTSNVKLHLTRLLLHDTSVALVHLRLILLVLKEGEHLRVLLLEALYLREIALDIPPHRLLLLFHFFELLLCTFSLRGALH
jgi:hypothetical protein